MCSWRAELLESGNGGDRGLGGEDGLNYSDLTRKKPWGRQHVTSLLNSSTENLLSSFRQFMRD